MIHTMTLILVAVLSLVPVRALGQGRPAGAIVEKTSGAVILKQNGKPIRLNSKSDIGRALRVGDSVYCEKGARLTLQTGTRTLELDEDSDWYTIVPPDSAKFKKVLAAYGRTGGRDRGGFTIPIFFAPANESSVAPDQFVLRWSPLKRSCVVSFVIRDASGKEIWQQNGIDGTSGSLKVGALQQALIGYREKKSSALLQLSLSDTCGNEDRVTFSLLPVADEKSLNQELTAWSGEADQLMVHLGRASVFVDHQMFPEAAEEYEAALTLAPDSVSLLKRTIDAERRTGNRSRAKALESRLAQKQ